MSSLSPVKQLPSSERSTQYIKLITQYINNQDKTGMKDLIKHLTTNELQSGENDMLVRTTLVKLIQMIHDKEHKFETNFDYEDVTEICASVLKNIEPRISSFNDVSFYTRDLMSIACFDLEEFHRALEVRAGLNVLSPSELHIVTVSDRLDYIAALANLYANPRINTPSEALSVLVSADPFMAQCRENLGVTESLLNVIYTHSNILVASLKHAEAAQKLLSVVDSIDKAETKRVVLMGVVRCLLAAPPSPLRHRIASTLSSHPAMNDPHTMLDVCGRGVSLHTVRPLVDKLLRSHAFKKDEVGLITHVDFLQAQIYAQVNMYNKPLVAHLLMEHNLIACAQVYDNITLPHLALYLGCTQDEAEALVVTLIANKRLSARLDDEDDVVVFTRGEEVMSVWGKQMDGLCKQILITTDAIHASQQPR